MPIWDSIKAVSKKAGDAAAVQAKKAKLKADIVLIDREIVNRQRAFGVAMYDHVAPLSQSQEFYAADDPLTSLIRPPLITAQKEVQALAAKKVKLKEQLAAAEANRAAAFPTKAETAGQKISNFGKATVLHGGEAKIKTELAVIERKIKGFKQQFGIDLFALLVEKEDKEGWLPTDRQVRNMYDTCRGDIHKLESTKKLKREEIISLGGSATEATDVGPTVATTTATTSPTSNNTSGFVPPQSSFSENPAPRSSNNSNGGFSDFPQPSSGSSQPKDGPIDLLSFD